MPAKNTIKTYVAGGHYHIYNRGVEKRIIFTDDQDYRVFLKYLKVALDKPINPEAKSFALQGVSFKGIPRQPKNFNKKIQLIAFCLMPNHYHLLIKQSDDRSIELFMRSVMTRYTSYFNKKHTRVGKLFQSAYKATLVDNDEYLLHLSRYIHRNPDRLFNSLSQAYSSYATYLGLTHTSWIFPQPILSFFAQNTLLPLKKVNTYKEFVEIYDQNDSETLGALTLEDGTDL